MLHSVVDRLGDLDLWLFLLAVFVLSAAESAIMLDLLVPGEVAMVVAGTVAAGGGPVAATMACAAVGAVVGDSVSFLLGATLGTRAVQRWAWTRRRFGPPVERAERYFARRGGVVVFVARWVGALRAVVPFVAGTGRMRYRRFLAWDVPAAITWGATVVGLGAAFGDDVVDVIEELDWWATVAVAGAAAGWLATRMVRSRRARAAAAGAAPGRRDPLRYPDRSDRGG